MTTTITFRVPNLGLVFQAEILKGKKLRLQRDSMYHSSICKILKGKYQHTIKHRH
jgi:hypothetical protein